jgi:hypothetical protein
MTRRNRPMQRIGELIPETARRLGLDDELRKARAVATFEAIVAERVPAASGGCRLVSFQAGTLIVDADAPIIAQELRLRATELLAAFAATPAGGPAAELRVRVRHEGPAV